MKNSSKWLSLVLGVVLLLTIIPFNTFNAMATDYSSSEYSVNFASSNNSMKSEISFRQDQGPYSLAKIAKQAGMSGTLNTDNSKAPSIYSAYSNTDKSKISFEKKDNDYLVSVSQAMTGYVEIQFYMGSTAYRMKVTTLTGKNTPAIDGNQKVWICGAARQETYPLRVSQLLEVHTEGFDADDQLTYYIRLSNSNSSATSCYLQYFSSSNMKGLSGTQRNINTSFQSADKYFALVDANQKWHATSKVEIKVTSKKLSKSYICTYEGFADANLDEDCKNANFIMFEGEKFSIRDLFSSSGITHITCSNCYVDNIALEGSTTVLENNVVKIGTNGTYTCDSVSRKNYEVTAKKEGRTNTSIDVFKLGTISATCDHHTGQNTRTSTSIWVIKKPVFVENKDGSITVSNITKDVNYTIKGVTKKAGDDPTLTFEIPDTVCRLTAEDGEAFLFRDFPITLTKKHTHDWSYSVKTSTTDTLVATCNGGEGCDNTDPTELKILPPNDLTYDNTAKSATLDQTAFAGQTSLPTIEYFEGGTKLSGAPKEPGTYTAKITVGGATAYTEFKITKNSYTITYSDDGNGTIEGDKSTATEGETVTLTTTPKTGYELDEIQVNDAKISGNTFTMPAKNTTVKAKFKPKTDTAYKVNVFVMGTDGKYSDTYTTQYSYTGTTDTTADVTSKISSYCTDAGSAVAFSKDDSKTNVLTGNIAGDGSLVLKVYLKRAQYTLKLNKGTGIETVAGAGTFYFNQEITATATQKTGYGTPSWSVAIPSKMPANDLESTASANPNTNTAYKVNVFVMGTDGKYSDTYTKQYSYTGTTDTTADVTSKISSYCTDAGSAVAFSKDDSKANVLTGNIAGDGSLVLKVYLKRAPYVITYSWGKNIPEGEDLPENIKDYLNATYNLDTTITNSVKIAKKDDTGSIEGYYIFDGWDDKNNGVIPINGGKITAKWKFEKQSYPVSYNEENSKNKSVTETFEWGSVVKVDPNGGIWTFDGVPHEGITTFTVKSPVKLNNPTLNGYEFIGWERTQLKDGTIYLKAKYVAITSPVNGDSSSLYIWILLISLSCAISIIVFKKKMINRQVAN